MNARRSSRHWLACAFVLAACGAAPDRPLATGRGLLTADASPPPGASTWARPEWRVGDRMTLVRGERSRGTLVVAAVTDAHYELDTGAGVVARRDRDLGNLGEWTSNGEPRHLLAPADTRYHWPLWLGKRWSCEFADVVPGSQSVVMQADYVVEDLDTVTVPAGTFEALRIVRTLRLVGQPGTWLTRTQVAWYAPAAGCEVRQLAGDALVELVELVCAAR
ncbi:MAG: hypothetical protein WAT39_19355 [Planctomycetota bacterium]